MQYTREQAIEFAESGKWKEMSFEERAKLQLKQEKLLMPFSVFHEAVEKATGHAVWTHQFASEEFWDVLRTELGLTSGWD